MIKSIYTAEFKEEAVKLSQSTEKPISLIAKELGLKPNTLYNWISRAMKNKLSPDKRSPKANAKNKYTAMEKELKSLKKDLKRTEMERDILKKAIAYFTKPEE